MVLHSKSLYDLLTTADSGRSYMVHESAFAICRPPDDLVSPCTIGGAGLSSAHAHVLARNSTVQPMNMLPELHASLRMCSLQEVTVR